MPTQIPKPTPKYFKKNVRHFWTDIGGQCYLNNKCNPKPPMKSHRLSKKQQEEDKKLKGELKVVCDHWKDWKFQIHWKD